MTVECHFQQNNDHLQNMDCLALHFKVRWFLSTIIDFTVIVTVGLVWLMVINATFTLVEETGVPGENHRPVASH
jgi:hypothetical protein